MLKNKNTIWQNLSRGFLFAILLLGSSGVTLAQSSSANYQAVDFINAESSLSSSGSYQLNDSLDYYGGTTNSTNYKECTGDQAVLSDCSFAITIPPIPPAPTPTPSAGGGGGALVGAGSIYYSHEDCNQVDCLNDEVPAEGTSSGTETSEPPDSEGPSVQPDQPIFKLPGIKEPAGTKPVESLKSASIDLKSKSEEEVAEIVGQVNTETEQFYQTVAVISQQIGIEIFKNVGLLWCEDLTCNQLKASAPMERLSEACQIFAFGGYQFSLNCLDWVVMWLLIGLVVIVIGQMVLNDQDLVQSRFIKKKK